MAFICSASSPKPRSTASSAMRPRPATAPLRRWCPRPRIATLGYDAISLVALLSRGQPFERFTDAILTDPNGFSGVDGIFRFRNDGSAERGLAILEVSPNGFAVVDPAPRSFPQAGF